MNSEKHYSNYKKLPDLSILNELAAHGFGTNDKSKSA
jgi:hypothetical protein